MFDLMFIFSRPRRKVKRVVWSNKDHDIPVRFIKRAGMANGVEYAQVEYEGKVSFVPMDELRYDY